jgi:phenylpropionate dioxygenase-like ring-hydroxylating dioxygenase large terminal subunit
LSPRQYTSEEQHAAEIERFFKPGWHFVAVQSELPKSGDYVTFELFGTPVLLRNQDGKPQAFVNVCSHRFCALVSAPRGHQAKLSCQYHGWEYDDDGNTRRIPDAPSFRPLEKGALGLCTLRTESCGQLVFVSLAAEGPSLREHLGDHFATMERGFAAQCSLVMSARSECNANWKVPVENNLESYHIDAVHPRTFGKMPHESQCGHEHFAKGSIFRTPWTVPRIFDFFCALTARKLGGEVTRSYAHVHLFPNLIYATTDLTFLVQAIVPKSAAACSITTHMFATGGRSTFWSRIARWLAWPIVSLTERVMDEDQSMFPRIQRGLASPRHPKGGLLATREERLRHFQEYIHGIASSSSSTGAAQGATRADKNHQPPAVDGTPGIDSQTS